MPLREAPLGPAGSAPVLGAKRGGLLALAIQREHRPLTRALEAFRRRYPEGDLAALERYLVALDQDGAGIAQARGLNLAEIDPPSLVEHLCRDGRLQDLDRWLSENRASMEAEIAGPQQRFDHLSELREAELRLQSLPADGRLWVSESPIPGTDRFADLHTADAFYEVKTVREPIVGWQGVSAQMSEALHKFEAAEEDGRAKVAVVYAVLDPNLHQGVERGQLLFQYRDGLIHRTRLDNLEELHVGPLWAPLEEWLNALSAKVPLDNRGLHRAHQILLRIDGAESASFVREGETWHRQ